MAEITVTAKVTYTYDTDDGIVTDTDSALDDVRSLLNRGEVTSEDFEFQTEVHRGGVPVQVVLGDGLQGTLPEEEGEVTPRDDLDAVSVRHWSQYGFDPETVDAQINWEDGQDLSNDQRALVVRRFYEENNPHLHEPPMEEALHDFADVFHSEVSRLVGGVRNEESEVTDSERLAEILDEHGKEVGASALDDGDLYAEPGMDPQVIRKRDDHGDTVLLTHLDGSETSLDIDTVVTRVRGWHNAKKEEA